MRDDKWSNIDMKFNGCKFVVGDIVTGLPSSDNRYGLTNTTMTEGIVTEVYGGHLAMDVKILKTKKVGGFAFGPYKVSTKHFTLIRRTKLEFKIVTK